MVKNKTVREKTVRFADEEEMLPKEQDDKDIDRKLDELDDDEYEEAPRGKCRRGCMRCCLLVWVCVMVGVLAIFYRFAHEPTYIAEILSRPTSEEAADRERCLFNDACDFCSLPVRMSLLPACESLALIAPEGTKSDDVRMALEAATRLTTGSDKCVLGNEVKLSTTSGVKPHMTGDCTDKIFMQHHVAQKFPLASKIKDVPGYSPRFKLYLWRDPAHAALNAYARFLHCRSAWMDCRHEYPTPKELEPVEWQLFAFDYFEMLRGHFNTSMADKSGLIVHYERLRTFDDLKTTLQYVSKARLLPRVERMLACVRPYAVSEPDAELLRLAYMGNENAHLGDVLTSQFADLGRQMGWWSGRGSG